jgi:acyl-CoA thioester hydrolase
MTGSSLPYRGDSVANPCRPTVIKAWTDYNDHFNVAYYTRAFDLAAEAWRAGLEGGLHGAPTATTRRSRVSYLREVHLGRGLEMTTQVLDATEAWVHLLQAMYVVEDGYLAAIEERLDVFTDADGAPRAIPAGVARSARGIAARHADLPVPDGWGVLRTEIG